MLQEQGFVTAGELRRGTMQRARSYRLLSSLLIGAGVGLILALIQVGVLWIFNPLHLSGAIAARLSAILTLPLRMPGIFVILLLELVVACVAVLLLAKPVKLAAYLNDVHTTQKEYHKLYTPLTALANLRQSPENYAPGDVQAMPVPMVEEPVSILDLVQQQNTHQMILGLPGAGKTMALKVYQYEASRRPLSLVLSPHRIPVYVPMKNYSLFLKQHEQYTGATRDAWQVTILDFLYASDLPGMRHLRAYLQQLSSQGRLLFLCDGLNEVDSNYLTRVSEELVYWMRSSRNRLVMTCREVDYREQSNFTQLVEEGQAVRAVLYPLQPEQVCEFVERYVERQDQRWQHTAGQIMQVIDRSRLRYHCTNPMMLFTLMGIIDKIGVERGKQIDTRGRLLRESVKQLIEYEQQQAKWSKGMPTEREVVRFLSEVACAARWANDRNAIQLRISAPAAIAGTGTRVRANFDELADELRYWLDEHPAKGPFDVAEDDEAFHEPYEDLAQLLQFSLSAALIEISASGVLSFRHELITEYFVAEYFFTADSKKGAASLPIREELLENVGRWSEPVAIWAGLMHNPLVLAERFGSLGRSNPAYVLQALALGLVCIGVLWTPPQAETQRTVVLPPGIAEALSIAVRNKAAREELARIFTRCAEEGGQEVYRSLLPLIMVEGVDELLTLLDQTIVPDLLLTHLQDAIDDVAYESQVKRITRVLGRFGSVVVDRVAQLALPAPERSVRLRAAAINILGGTADFRAVDPLVARFSDADNFIVERATNALIRLGPELTLSRILQELEKRTPGPFTRRIHWAALLILGRFLDEQDLRRQVSLMQYQRILESIVPALTSNYQAEPEVQKLARDILVRQGSNTAGVGTRDNRWEKAIDALIQYLPSQNEIAARNVIQALQEIGEVATPHLLTQLQQASELVRLRVTEIFKVVRDVRALPPLLRLMGDPSPLVQQQIGDVLQVYAPDSISGLIDLVLNGQSDMVAEHAAQILSSIGEPVVEPIIGIIFHIVPARTRFLVQVLAQVHDLRVVPALITLLQVPGIEPLLAITVVRALSQYPDQRVVSPLLSVLSSSNPQLYEEGIDALSQLGEITLDGLFATLDAPLDSVIAQRVRRAILGMTPFPGEVLIALLEQSSRAQAQQIMALFKTKGTDAAQVLTAHLLHKDENVREYIHQALNEMPGPLVVPALLDVLDQPALRKVASSFLLKYPEAAVSPLVDLLGEHDRGDAAAAILPQFGPKILRSLISGLDDVRSLARERTQSILVTLVHQQQNPQEILRDIVHLFNPEPPTRARDALLYVLANELADCSIPALLDGLEDAYLIEDVSDAFTLLARKGASQQTVLESLEQALYVNEKRRGAADALVRIGAPAVPRMGELITVPNQAVAKVAQYILRDIGVPALPFIWTAHSDLSNPERREAALDIFHSMPTAVIKDALVSQLVSDRPDDIAMAVALLLERIRDEAEQQYADQVMIPELVDYVQAHTVEKTNLRIIALLLLLGERVIKDHFIQALEDLQQPRRQIIYALLLLGEETQEILFDLFNDPDTTIEMRAELATVLGMVSAPEVVAEYAQNISKYGLSASRTSPLFPEQLAISLRALGGLLAGGHWNVRKIQELRDACKDGSPARELFNVLLGVRYEPQLAKLQNDLQNERDTHKKEVLSLGKQLLENQQRTQTLTEELEHIRQEHGVRSDELHQATREKEALRLNFDRVTKDYNVLSSHFEQAMQERNALKEEFEQLNTRLAQALQENQELHRNNAQLIWQLKHP